MIKVKFYKIKMNEEQRNRYLADGKDDASYYLLASPEFVNSVFDTYEEDEKNVLNILFQVKDGNVAPYNLVVSKAHKQNILNLIDDMYNDCEVIGEDEFGGCSE